MAKVSMSLDLAVFCRDLDETFDLVVRENILVAGFPDADHAQDRSQARMFEWSSLNTRNPRSPENIGAPSLILRAARRIRSFVSSAMFARGQKGLNDERTSTRTCAPLPRMPITARLPASLRRFAGIRQRC